MLARGKKARLLNDCRSKDITRPNLQHCYSTGTHIVSTDGKRLFIYKHAGVPEGYCMVDDKAMDILPMIREGEYVKWEHAARVSSTGNFIVTGLDVPKCFKQLRMQAPCAIGDNGEFIFSYKDNDFLKLDASFLRFFAGESVVLAHHDIKSAAIISQQRFTPSNESILEQDWVYFAMPLRY